MSGHAIAAISGGTGGETIYCSCGVQVHNEEIDPFMGAYTAHIAQETREQVAREVSTYLPIKLRDEATDGCGWLSDMDGVWLDHGTDVSTPSGSIDVDQIGEYAARIARGGEGE